MSESSQSYSRTPTSSMIARMIGVDCVRWNGASDMLKNVKLGATQGSLLRIMLYDALMMFREASWANMTDHEKPIGVVACAGLTSSLGRI